MIKNLIAPVEVEKAKKYDNLQTVLQSLDRWLANDEKALAILEHIRLGVENGYLSPHTLIAELKAIDKNNQEVKKYVKPPRDLQATDLRKVVSGND